MTTSSPVPFEAPDEARIKELENQVDELRRVLNGEVSFGTPNALELAAIAKHMQGAWVEVSVESLDANVTCTHNLDLQAPTGVVNVRWLLWGFQHNGTGVSDGTATISINYEDGTVAANSIGLRFYAAGGRTVSATHPLTVTLYFVPVDG